MDGEMVCVLPVNSHFLFSPGSAARHRGESALCRQVHLCTAVSST